MTNLLKCMHACIHTCVTYKPIFRKCVHIYTYMNTHTDMYTYSCVLTHTCMSQSDMGDDERGDDECDDESGDLLSARRDASLDPHCKAPLVCDMSVLQCVLRCVLQRFC